MTEKTPKYVVAALYKFTPMPDFEAAKAPLAAVCEAENVTGTLLLAHEGINGTIAGSRAGIDRVLCHIRALPGCADLEVKEGFSVVSPFIRLKVRLKREIVTMGVPDIDPLQSAGTYVAPQEWNGLIASPDTVVIDTRNDYEVGIGTFENAINPETANFRELPRWTEANLPEDKSTKIAMFCTGGIRCEKATALLKERGYSEVYHLKGGILKYLEEVPVEDSLWKGECFVFDRRVSVGHGLKPGPYQQCAMCRQPFVSGEGAGGYAKSACPTCETNAVEIKRQRAEQRQHQIELARARGEEHLGPRHKGPKHKPQKAK